MNKMLVAISQSFRPLMLVALLVGMATMTVRTGASTPLSAITITNNSQHEIRAIYLAHAGSDDWGDNQLGGAVISPGGTYTLSFTWDQSTVKIVAEDKDGCFISTTVETSSTDWTITNESARNCGGSQ